VRIGLLTREYPPEVYGGAGVHVEYLAAQLRLLTDVEVHCFGQERAGATAYRTPADLAAANPALQTLGTDLAITDGVAGCSLVHSHTWYANMAGHWAKLLHGVPHVVILAQKPPAVAEQFFLVAVKEEAEGGGIPALDVFCDLFEFRLPQMPRVQVQPLTCYGDNPKPGLFCPFLDPAAL